MANETQVGSVISMLGALLTAEPEYFWVDVKILPGNNVKVALDGDSGIAIDKCVQFSKALYKQLEEANVFAGADFSLEVSSPGLDEPLKIRRQYVRNVGRLVDIVLTDGIKIAGRLTDVTEDGIIVEETKGKGKNQSVLGHPLLFSNIKTTKIQVVF